MSARPSRSRVVVRATALALAVALVAACGGGPAPPGPGAAKKGGPAPVVVATAQTADVPIDLTAIGHVEAAATVAVSSRVAGELKAVHFAEGQAVKAGDPLFDIDPRPYQVARDAASARLTRDQALLKNAVDDLERYSQLAAQDYASHQQLEQARTNAASLRASVLADRADVESADLQLSFATIAAPISGVTGRLLVDAGNLVKANDPQPLVEIRQVAPVRVAFTVPERYLPRIRERMSGDSEPLPVAATPEGGERAANGVLTLVDNGVDPSTGTILLLATFPNDDGYLWPGQFVKVAVRLALEQDRVVVPARALQDGQKGTFVYVVGADAKVTMQPVAVGRVAGEVATIERGLVAGQVVVTDGQLRLFPGAEVTLGPPKSATNAADAGPAAGAEGGSHP